MGTPEIEAFLTHLAVDQKVAASTQNQALNAILFLYREVLKQDLEGRIDAIRAKRPSSYRCVQRTLAPDDTFQHASWFGGNLKQRF